MTQRDCATCTYSYRYLPHSDMYCRRYAPRPHTFLKYYELELLREIAYAQHTLADFDEPSKDTDLNTEATEASNHVSWPYVSEGDWCGEYQSREKDIP